MSEVLTPERKVKRTRAKKAKSLIGPTDPKIDAQARERLITARVGLLVRHSFFGNLATRLRLENADEWCETAATDGLKFYYNSRFIMQLRTKEVEFLVGHEVLHVVYDHIGRRDHRDPQIFNIANDYAVNADLKRHKIGEFITTVPCLYEMKYDGKSSEEIYEDLMKNAKRINMDDLIDKLLDDHMEEDDDNDGDGDGDKEGRSKRPQMSDEERERVRQEVKQAIISAASAAEPGTLPGNVQRMVKDITEPTMPWRELIQSNLTSAVRNDYSWMRPSRRSWHIDAILPGMTPGEEIDIVVGIDTSGSIGSEELKVFLGEIQGIMNSFDSYRIKVLSWDTSVYNVRDFNSDTLDSISEYVPEGGGGTSVSCVWEYLKQEGIVPNRLILFTDGYLGSDYGDGNYCDTTWILYKNPNFTAPHGVWAHYN